MYGGWLVNPQSEVVEVVEIVEIVEIVERVSRLLLCLQV